MTKVDLQYDLINYTPANAAPPESNFNRLEQHINQELIERDGTVAMRAQLRLVGDPVADLDATPKQYVDQILPVGLIMMFGGAGTPPGGRWAICNGAEVESSMYPELFAVIGQAYSPPGTPAGRFHLPPLTNRMPLGAGVAAVGATGGSADTIVPLHSHDMAHTHPAFNTGNDSPDHAHVGVDHLHSPGSLSTGWQSTNHVHGPGTQGQFLTVTINPSGIVGSGGAQLAQAVFNDYTAPANVDHYHAVNSGATGPADRGLTTAGATARHRHLFTPANHTGRTANEGVAPANTNLPPYVVVQYIIRVR
jgi:microcystin-dependent protein